MQLSISMLNCSGLRAIVYRGGVKIRKSFHWAVKMADLADGKDATSPFFNVERSTLRFIWARNSTPQKFMLEQLVSSMPLTISLR